jgi:hypothetical protein
MDPASLFPVPCSLFPLFLHLRRSRPGALLQNHQNYTTVTNCANLRTATDAVG